MDAALQTLLTETVMVAPYAGQNDYGVPAYGTAVAHPARSERRFLTVLTAVGQALVERTVLFLNGDFLLSERDQLTLDDGTVSPIQGIKRVKDLDGTLSHYEVMV